MEEASTEVNTGDVGRDVVDEFTVCEGTPGA